MQKGRNTGVDTYEAPRDGGDFHAPGLPPRVLSFGRVVAILTAGNHHPLLCELEDATGPAGMWVVKPQAIMSTSDVRGPLGVLSELAGAEVCAWAGVASPRTGLVRFPAKPDIDAVHESVPDLDEHQRAEIAEIYRMNRGVLAYCSRWIQDGVDLQPGSFRTRKLRDEAATAGARLFFVDAYIRNDDRTEENSNAMWYRDRIVAIDHAHAFAGLASAGATGKALAARTVVHSRSGFERHILRTPLSRSTNAGQRLEETAELLAGTPDADIELLTAIWPPELDSDTLGTQPGKRRHLVEFLVHRRTHAMTIAENLLPFLKDRRNG
jgi:hypothetical protein